jgi:hypothetical protein
MGIFDDAIREHLDLKRRHGADESEVQQLEDEAFGLPARPGDPDFPETGQEEQAQAPEEAPAPDPGDETPPHGDALLPDAEEKPPAPPEQAPIEDPDAPSLSTTEREAIAAQPTEFFDQTPDPLELGELDLDLDEELEDVGTLDDPATGEEPAPEPVDEPTPVDELEVTEEEPPAPEEPEAPAESAAPEEAEGEPEPEAEDVLEETPEFLRDNPDDDELWFEQGQPKDFDF